MLQPPLVGRQRELAALGQAMADAVGGRGATCLLLGDAGIGKSRLAGEMANRARNEGTTVAWGRCWEAGGAPAFWPWVQVARALLRARPDARAVLGQHRERVLARLLPELGAQADVERFELLEALGTWLCDLSFEHPLLVVLEDLHAADAGSLSLLDSLTRQVHSTHLLVVGTARHAELPDGAPGQTFLRLARDANSLHLAPLGDDDARILLQQSLPDGVTDTVAAAAHEATEGNPLFVVELARLLRSGPSALDPRSVVPATVRATIHQRLDRLPDHVRDALGWAAVLGREFPVDDLRGVFASPTLGEALRIAADAAIVLPVAGGCARFTHVLIQEVLLFDLPEHERAERHGAVGRWLAAASPVRWAEVAHHLARAGNAQAWLDALVHAADEARGLLAWEDAAQHATTALELLPEHDPRRHAMLLALGLARIGLGDPHAGQARCRAAFDLARRTDRAQDMAEAALAYGSVYRFGHIDPQLIALIEEALAVLPTGDSALRARLLARLAAAQQPATDPSGPIAVAEQAIDMARRVGHEPALVAALRAGCSAMVDLVDPRKAAALNEELLALAVRRAGAADVLRARVRLVMAYHESGDVPASYKHQDEAIRLATVLDHPRYRWRAPALQAARALWQGRLVEAAELSDEARRTGDLGGDDNALNTWLFQRCMLCWLRADREGMEQAARTLSARFAEMTGWADAALLPALPCTGARDVRPDLPLDGMTHGLSDHTLYEALAELALARGDRTAARRVLQVCDPDHYNHMGVLGLVLCGPQSRNRALAYRVLGDHQAAIDAYRHGLARLRADGGRPLEALLHAELGAFLDTLGHRDAAEHHASAREIAEPLGMTGWLQRWGAAPAPRASAPELVREGAVWRCSYAGAVARVGAVKGVAMLAALVARPGHEIHVLDLVHPGGEAAEVDRADAGEVLDDTARAAYRARAETLRDELADARERHDLGHIDRIRSELEFLADELASGEGLGGRARRTPGAVERARVSVRKRIKDGIDRIAAVHPDLGRHLRRSIRTGTTCAYEP